MRSVHPPDPEHQVALAMKGVWPFLLAELLILLTMILFPPLVMVPAKWFSG